MTAVEFFPFTRYPMEESGPISLEPVLAVHVFQVVPLSVVYSNF
jgi:hypothetical protein